MFGMGLGFTLTLYQLGLQWLEWTCTQIIYLNSNQPRS